MDPQLKDALLPFIAIIATAVGWMLNQLGQWFTARRERKKALSRAISSMIQLRDRITLLPEAMQWMSTMFHICGAHQTVLTSAIETMFMPDDGPSEEFDKAMSSLAEYDPVLAAQICRRNQASPLLKKLRRLSVRDPLAAATWGAIEKQVVEHGQKNMDDSIVEIAQLHSRRLAKSVKKDLERKPEPPKEMIETLMAAFQQVSAPEEKVDDNPHKRAPRVPIWRRA